MLTDFALIENYKKMLKSLEENVDEPALCDDQKVPDSHESMNPDILKPIIKVEEPHQQDFCYLADMVNNYNYDSADITQAPRSLSDFSKSSFHFPQSKHVLSSTKDFLQIPVPTSSVLLDAVSSQSSQMIQQSLSSSVSFSSPSTILKTAVSTKTRTYVTELACSGCTVITNSTDYLSDTSPDLFIQEESLEYTDLDKPIHSDAKKPFQAPGCNDSETLENAVQYMQDIIQQDSDNLNIPFDPQSWTCEHACRWVGWICQRHQLYDVSKQLTALNGQVLCSWSYDDFSSHFGSSGNFLFNELDLWKAANSCYSHHSKPSLESIPCHTMSTTQNYFMGDSNSFSLSPASSPALSSCGSSTPDSSNSSLSQHSEMADKDSVFYPDVKKTTTSDSMNNSKIYKRVPGRGHKKSIALWQFLRKLLLSEQNYGCIRWIDRKTGIFKIEDSKKVATLWGIEKNRPAMNYDKLSRSVRQYYKKGIIRKPAQSKRLLYQFCPEYL